MNISLNFKQSKFDFNFSHEVQIDVKLYFRGENKTLEGMSKMYLY